MVLSEDAVADEEEEEVAGDGGTEARPLALERVFDDPAEADDVVDRRIRRFLSREKRSSSTPCLGLRFDILRRLWNFRAPHQNRITPMPKPT
jgi:hypothetical protein